MHKIRVFGVLIPILFIACISGISAERSPTVSGLFYPSDAAKLQNMVDGHLQNVRELPEIDGQIIAIVVPHAGLVYSGQIAAYSYKLLEQQSKSTIILCGPSHKFAFQGLSIYGPFVNWRTPLGVVACDNALCDQLLNFNKDINILSKAHDQEHCLEVQLPYLQTVLDNFKIVPIVMGRQDNANIELMASALSSLSIDNNTIMVASTDWQHYRPSTLGWQMDSLGISCLQELDADRLSAYLQSGQVEMCGGGSTVAVIKAAVNHGADKVKILKYGDSGDVSGDNSSVVGYAAAVLYKSNSTKSSLKEKASTTGKAEKELPNQLEIDDADRVQLLDIARTSIEKHLGSEDIPEFDVSDNIKKYGAAFVTLNKNNQLRGCIGYTTGMGPLYQCVSECAIKAAMNDPRFKPITSDELNDIHIEISVLSPLQKVDSWDEIVVGRDGLMVFKGPARGLLLPQVAVDYGWDRTTFLEQTCRKAGLNKNDYLSPEAVVFKFQADIFGE